MEYRVRLMEMDPLFDPLAIVDIDEGQDSWDEALDLYEQLIEEYTIIGGTENRIFQIFILDGLEKYKEKIFPEENYIARMYEL